MASSSNMTCSNTCRRNSMPASFGNRGSLASVDSTQASSFPSKLYNILDSEEECISWMPHGRAFLVRDTDKFMEDIAPRYFKMLKYRSFTRQLNLWGFKK